MKTPKVVKQVAQNIRATYHTQKNNALFQANIFITLGAFALSLFLIIGRWNVLPPAIPLWYSHPWGLEQLAHPLWLFIIPTSCILWYFLTILTITYISGPYRVFTQIISLSCITVQILSLITLVQIITLIV